ncbi:MAG: arylsulfatase [Phycisphaerae bacterium]|jgi:arylsulfatase A-like enzyme|nr:arylsulfatase [Phycisphaerae bacterium]
MNRRRFLKSASLTAAAMSLGVRNERTIAAKPTKRPNVVIFVSDDMGWSDVGYHGSTIKTPSIDGMVAKGVELDRFYAFPICSPTRIAMMTGRSPIRFGIIRPIGGRLGGPPLNERFMSQDFRDAGYYTAMTGKWHLGSREGYRPNDRGFDHSHGHLSGFIDYYKHTNAMLGTPDWYRNGKPLAQKGYSTDLICAEAVSIIKKRDPNKPLFLYVPFNAPHSPAQAPEELIKKYSGGPQGERRPGRGNRGGNRATRAAMIDSMDQAIGKILKTLDEEGMTKRTLAMFFCDNGASSRAEKRRRETQDAAPPRRPRAKQVGMGNAPFSGGKSTAQEGGIRLPAVMQWPGVLKAGAKSSQMFTVLDMLPTLTCAAGFKPGTKKPLDGENVWPAIRDGKVVPRKGVVIGCKDLGVFDGPWKLHQDRGVCKLYNIEKDPTEKTDLAEKHPDVVSRLKAIQAPYAEMVAKVEQNTRRRRPGGDGKRPRPGRNGEPGEPPGKPRNQRPE